MFYILSSKAAAFSWQWRTAVPPPLLPACVRKHGMAQVKGQKQCAGQNRNEQDGGYYVSVHGQFLLSSRIDIGFCVPKLGKCAGNIEYMVADALVIRKDFRIQDGSLHMAFSIPHTLNLVGAV